MQVLDVINDMLGTRGERPVNSLSSPHRLMGACQDVLARATRACLSSGWWFNTEVTTLYPSPEDNRIYLANDILSVKDNDAQYAQRGRLLYDSLKGTDEFAGEVKARIVRELPFESIPETVAVYVAAAAVYRFQRDYDGDSTKTRDLRAERDIARAFAYADETRHSRANLIDINPTLNKITRLKGYRRSF